MAYQEIVALDADTTISLGGTNRKTGKKNPTEVEGYYVGKKQVDSPKSRDGKANLYIFKTEVGNIGVWGKTNLDKKMQDATLGRMTLIEQSGTQMTKNGEMYLYTVKQDPTNSIQVAPSAVASSAPELDESEEIDGQDNEDTYDQEEVRQNASVSALEKKAKLDALLAKGKRK